MSKHTPGPWFAANDDATDCPAHKHSGLALIDTGRTADWPIARLMEWNNVPLVLAAPDLLDVVKQFAVLVRELEGTEIEYGLAIALSEVLRNADEAIQKAEGK